MRTLILSCLLAVGCSGASEPPGQPSPPRPTRLPPGVVRSRRLWKEYKENAVAARKEYGDAEVRVGGRVVAVREGLVDLEGGDSHSLVECRFAAGHDDALAAIRPGSVYVLRGRVLEFAFGSLRLDDCRPDD